MMQMTMAEELDYLREENRQLKQRLVIVAPTSETVPREWKLTPIEARIFVALTSTDVMPTVRIKILVWGTEDMDSHPLSKAISSMRKKLAPYGITIMGLWKFGYQLHGYKRGSTS